ncbi:MAG TPA: hypothetical protein VEY50_09365 [Lysobacter sp.]|nr:hypothetical protein [Lysobacter sp.]
MNAATETVTTTPRSAPVKATWVCLILAWVLFLIPLPGAGVFVGWPLNLVAFILAIVVMARGFTRKGLIPLIASLVVSPIVYFIGWGILGAAALSGDAYQDYKARAEARDNSAAAVEQAAPADAIKVTAAELFASYEANEVAADSQYKGKTLEITGKVAGIDSGMGDEPVVQLESSNMFQHVQARGLSKDVAASLAKGSKITLVCEGAGEVIGSPMLDDCRVR